MVYTIKGLLHVAEDSSNYLMAVKILLIRENAACSTKRAQK
jgi:hypothetical protein